MLSADKPRRWPFPFHLPMRDDTVWGLCWLTFRNFVSKGCVVCRQPEKLILTLPPPPVKWKCWGLCQPTFWRSVLKDCDPCRHAQKLILCLQPSLWSENAEAYVDLPVEAVLLKVVCCLQTSPAGPGAQRQRAGLASGHGGPERCGGHQSATTTAQVSRSVGW